MSGTECRVTAFWSNDMKTQELNAFAAERDRTLASAAVVLTTIYGLFLVGVIALNAGWM